MGSNNSEVQKLLDAKLYNIDTRYLDEDQADVQRISALVQKSVKSIRREDDIEYGSGLSQLYEYIEDTKIRRQKIYGNMRTPQEERERSILSTKGGMRGLSDINGGDYEKVLYEASAEISKNAFAQAREYDILHTIIPELDKITNDFTRDICQGTTASTTIINKVFDYSDFTDYPDVTEKMVDDMNDEFIERVVKRNKLDEKVPELIKNSLKSGAAPVIAIPYKEIFELVDKNARENPFRNRESFYDNFASNESIMTKSFFNKCNQTISTESNELGPNYKKLEKIIESNKRQYFDHFISIEEFNSIDEIDNDKKLEAKKKTEKKLAIYQDLKDNNITPRILQTLKYFDDRIEVVNPMSDNSILYLLKDQIKKVVKMKHINDKDYRKDDKFDIDLEYHNKGGNGFDVYNHASDHDKINMMNFDYQNIEDFYIKTPDPDKLIPFRINDVSIGYWLIETNDIGYNTTDNNDYTSFTDVIRSLGVGDDNLVANNSGDIENSSVFGSLGNNALNGFANQFALGANVQGEQKELERLDMIKNMIADIVSIKSDFADLKDDKLFNDALVDIIRTGHIVEKRIRLTFIPSHYVTYFSNDLDKNGLPKSLYHGTLFYCYLYISSILHSLLIKANKSSNKDIVEIDVGRHKNVSQAINMIANALSTRNLHAGSAQSYSSLAQVFRNSMSNYRVVIPTYKGEKFYNYTEGTNMNDISVDDNMTSGFLKSIIVVSNYPLGRLEGLGENDYSRSVVVRELAYNRVIIGKKSRYSGFVTRMLKNCGMYTEFKNQNIKKFLHLLRFDFPVPSDLMVSNYNESIGGVKTFIDDLTTYLAEYKIDRAEYGPILAMFKKQLAKDLLPEIPWSEYEDMFKKLEEQLPELIIELRKKNLLVTKEEESNGGANYGSSTTYGSDDGGSEEEGDGSEEDDGGLGELSDIGTGGEF